MKTSMTALAVFLLMETSASAIQLDDPTKFQVVQTWSGPALGVPAPLGGMLFSEDGNTLFIVGASERSDSAVYALPVLREVGTRRVTGFGAATLLFEGSLSGLDAGIERGPGETLFYTYWNAHYLGERPKGSNTETVYDMSDTGIPSSVAGLAFSPYLMDSATGFGLLQVSSWYGDGLYNVPLTPLGGGLYQPGTATLFVKLPQQGTGAIQYIPQGLYAGNLMYVNWDYGEVRMLVIDRATGLPIDDETGEPTLGTTNPRNLRFASELGVGPWGLEFDPQTLDFFVATWGGDPPDTIIQFSGPGFANQAPVALEQNLSMEQGTTLTIICSGTDADGDELIYETMTEPAHGTLSGEAPHLTYTPAPSFSGTDSFTFRASDGKDYSNIATITIGVTPKAAGGEDSGCDCRTATARSGLLPLLAIALVFLARAATIGDKLRRRP